MFPIATRFQTLFRTPALPVAAARLISLAAAAAQLPVLSHNLDSHEFVAVTAAISASVYFGLLTVEPVTLAFQRRPGSALDRQNYRYASARWILLFSIGATGLLTITTTLGHWHWGVAIVGWGSSLAWIRFVSAAWLMWGRPWLYFISVSTSTLTRTGILVGGVLTGGDALVALGLAGLASVIVIQFTRPRRGNLKLSDQPWTFSFGMSLALASASMTVILGIDRVLLPTLISNQDAAATYAAMAMVTSLSVASVYSLLTTAYYPSLVRAAQAGDEPSALATLNKSLLAVTFIFSLSMIGIISLGEAMISGVVGRDRFDVGLLVAVASSATMLAYGRQLSWIYHLNQDVTALRNRSTAALSSVVFVAIGAETAGINGMVIGLGVGTLAYCVSIIAGSRVSRIGLASIGIYFVVLASASLALPGWQIFCVLAAIIVSAAHWSCNIGERAVRGRDIVAAGGRLS